MKSMGLQNVKAFVDTGDVAIAPITVFVGRNSSGKSTFLRFIQVLSQTFNNGPSSPILLYDDMQPNVIDFGFFEDVVNLHTASSFSVSLDYPITLRMGSNRAPQNATGHTRNRVVYQSRIIVTYAKPNARSRVFATKIQLFINGQLFSSLDKIETSKKYIFRQYKTLSRQQLTDIQTELTLEADTIANFMPMFDEKSVWRAICAHEGITSSRAVEDLYFKTMVDAGDIEYNPEDPAPERTFSDTGFQYRPPEKSQFKILRDAYDAYRVANIFYTGIYSKMRSEFTNVHYIGPFRADPKRYYRRDENEHLNVGVHGDFTGSLLINDAREKGDLVTDVSKWFDDALEYQIGIREIGVGSGLYQIAATDKDGSTNNLMDVGYGISQVLPIVTQISMAREQSRKAEKDAAAGKHRLHAALAKTFVIEQPELHLHPNAQAFLASLFASCVHMPSSRDKILIETHSEHLIRAIQLLIADTDNPYHLTKDQVRIYYVHNQSEDPEKSGSWIEEMQMDEYGQFLNKWPKGFFDKAYSLTSDLMSAVSKRKHREQQT